MERTVVLIKPDGMEKHVVGQIIDRFERQGLTLSALKMVQLISRYFGYMVCTS